MLLRAMVATATVSASVGAAGLALAPPAAAAPSVTRLYSATLNTCLDVRTTDPGKYFLDTYGHQCDSSAAQAFTLYPLAGSYEIVSQSNGQCIDKYRSALRQQTCSGAAPDTADAQWILQRVGTSGHRYRFVWSPSAGTSSSACVQVAPQPSGYPGPLFQIATCSASAPGQVLTLDGKPR